MLDTDLTSISTQGWFTEVETQGGLLPVSTFGWWYVVVDDDEVVYFNILSFDLEIVTLLQLDVSR